MIEKSTQVFTIIKCLKKDKNVNMLFNKKIRLSLLLMTQKFPLMKKIQMKENKHRVLEKMYIRICFFQSWSQKVPFPKRKEISVFASSLLKYQKFLQKNYNNFLILGLENSISLDIINFFLLHFLIFRAWKILL